jgi:hypothetical protein
MRLPALCWTVADALEAQGAKRARLSGTFYELKANEWSEVQNRHATLAEIANGEKEIKLRLVVR